MSRRLLTEVEVVPPGLPAVLSIVEHENDPPPTEDEAREALLAIGAVTTPESIKAMQIAGTALSRVKIPRILLSRQFKSLDAVDRCKRMCNTLLDAASGESEMGSVKDPELALGATKTMAAVLGIEERMHGRLLELHEKSQPEKKPSGGKNTLGPVNHFHVHNPPKPA